MVKNDVFKRVQEHSVKALINQGWAFAPKSAYKAYKVNGGKVTVEAVPEQVKRVKKDKNKKAKKNKVEAVETSDKV